MEAVGCARVMDGLRVPQGVSRIGSGMAVGRNVFLGNARVLSRQEKVSLKSSRRRVVAVEAKIREIFMPALSSTMTEGKIVSWVKGEGEKLSKGESVVVVESDKADMDVETFYDGYLAVIVVGEGEVAPVGAAIGLLAESEAEIDEAKSRGGKPTPTAAAPATPSAPSPVAPVAPVAAATVAAEAAPSAPPPPPPAPIVDLAPARDGRIVATPYAKQLAKKLNVKLASVTGSGPFGRIVASDVESASGKPVSSSPPPAISSTPPPPPLPAQMIPSSKPSSPPPAAAAPVPGTTVPFTAMQKGVARNMNASLTVPTFQVGYTITTDALDALYKKVKAKGVTMTVLLAKAVALALAKHPIVNSACKDGESLTYNSSINIAVAVALDGGLLTPVLSDADKADIYSLGRKWKELVEKARSKTLTPAEFTTGTFTLSNLGMFGVDRFSAILPPGTGAIMAVGASKPTMVVSKDGMFGVKNQMQVNVTADHRIIYGGDLAEFLQTFAAIVEDPKDLVF